MNSAPKKTFDKYDIAILSALIQDPRSTTVEISSTVHLSRTAVARRLAILRDRSALVDIPDLVSYQSLGFEVDATIEIATPFNGAASVSQELLAMPEVLSVSTTTGRGQLVVRCIALNMSHFRLLVDKIQRFGEVSSNIVMSTTRSRLPLSERLAAISRQVGQLDS